MTFRLYPPVGQTALSETGETITSAGIALTALTTYYRTLLATGGLLTRNESEIEDGTSPLTFLESATGGFATANVVQFGALGTGLQELVPDVYTSDIDHTQQTADGLAINRAIRYLRTLGGGTLYIPRGTYRIYGYLETIDFPCNIVGDGIGVTVLKNCDASPVANGYGILRINPTIAVAEISIYGLTLDGNLNGEIEGIVVGRSNPGGAERRAYPLVVYGKPHVSLDSIECKNSPIDCMATVYTNGPGYSLRATNCVFSNAYRNTVSTVGGWNQQYSNCTFEKAGIVFNGAHPRYVLDVEPDAAVNTIKNLTFTNCVFREAGSTVVGGTWCGNVKFVGCTFDASDNTDTTKYLTNIRGGEFLFSGCSFYETTTRVGLLRLENPIGSGDYAETEYTEFRGCTFDGVGVAGYGKDMRLSDSSFRNSFLSLVFGGTGSQNLTVKNVTLTNVFDCDNFGSGSFAAFAIVNAFDGFVDIDGLTIRVLPDLFPPDPNDPTKHLVTFTAGRQYGINLAPLLGSASEARVANVHVCGYYRRLPLGLNVPAALDANYWRDWASPNAPPADTVGQTAGPGGLFYRSCTMYGDAL